MPIDDSFLKKEAAKRRAFTIMIYVLLANVVVWGILLATGVLHREPTISRIILYSELVILGGVYLYFRKKYKDDYPN